MDLLEWVKKHGLFDLTNGNQSYAAVNHVSLLHRQLQVVCLRCFIVPGQHGEGNDTTVHMTLKKKTPPDYCSFYRIRTRAIRVNVISDLHTNITRHTDRQTDRQNETDTRPEERLTHNVAHHKSAVLSSRHNELQDNEADVLWGPTKREARHIPQ